MEEILQKIDQFFRATDNVALKLEDDYEIFVRKLDNIAFGNNETSMTPQQRKKIKRLSVVIDNEDSVETVSDIVGNSCNEVVIKTEVTEVEASRTSNRLARAAKLKIESFKQEKSSRKLRRPSGSEDTPSMTRLMISSRELNDVSNVTTDSGAALDPEKNANYSNVRLKRSLDNNNKDDSLEAAKKVKVDESVVVVSNEEMPAIELSDSGGTDKLMPPPVEIPKKRVTRKAQQKELKTESVTRSSRQRIKQEKLSIATATTDRLTASSDEPSDTIIEVEIKAEKHEKEVAKTRAGTKKKGKKQSNLNLAEVKSERKEQADSEKEGAPKIRSRDKHNPSMESVYEDAISDDNNKGQDIADQPEKVVEDEQSTKQQSEFPEGPKVASADATFVSTEDVPRTEANATFIASTGVQQLTFILEKAGDFEANKTHIISKQAADTNDATFSVNNETFKPHSKDRGHDNEIIRSSIMTEEDSADDEIMQPPPQRVLTKMKSKKEIFNPCIQSPVKKKVEAIEKHIAAMASPAATRQTKTKSKENKDPELACKNNTPLLRREIPKLLTPNPSNITPNIGIQYSKNLASSTSKLTQMQKQTKPTVVTAATKTQSLSRDNSVEDIKRGGFSKLQQLAENKKQKREQKQQQAALTRETREKERAEKLKKAMHDKEEKTRRKAQDAEMRKVLDDINKNMKHQDQEEKQREAQRLFEKKQQERILAESARREREMLDNLKIQKSKEELQKKLLHNRRLQDQMKSAKIAIKAKLPYDFDLLNSDDSTDDEDRPSLKRPHPPIWSKSSMRHILIDRQADLSTKIVDSFFSVQPMTPDLREIFPAINPKYLKRNSSVYWNTPPRYSQLPKY